MKRDIMILDDFWGTGSVGKLFFSRYEDQNPAFFFIDDDNVVSEFSIDLVDFYCEYPFGEYSLMVMKDKATAEMLYEAGVVNLPVFHIENGIGILPVCEISNQVIDLLKVEGRFYV